MTHIRFFPRLFSGSPVSVVSGSRTYASSIDSGIANLALQYRYDSGFRRLPIIVVVHGYSESISAITTTHRDRYVRQGFFVVVPGMRGRDGASGSCDASGREIQDIIDGVEDIKSTFPSIVDSDRVFIDGYSGGGGNALAAVAKAPDYWTGAVSHSGPSDYGWRSNTGWYYTNAGFQASLTTDIGAAPTVQPGWWRSRNHADALAYQMALAPRGRAPRLWLYHDADDGSVSVAHSDRVRDVLDAAGLSSLYTYHRSTSSDPVRYLHGYPADSPGVLTAEADWLKKAINLTPWKVPHRGTVLVSGFLITKRFRIWLGLTSGGANPKTDAAGGKVHVARVIYDALAGTFAILPLTGALRYRIEFGSLVATGDTADPVTVTPA